MWKSININKNNIEIETSRAVLIKLPNKSAYAGWMFWHPAKCIRAGRNSNSIEVSYTEEFRFKIFKNGKGKYNKYEKLEELEIGVEEFEMLFETIDENIRHEEYKNIYETHKPAELEPQETSALEELLDE